MLIKKFDISKKYILEYFKIGKKYFLKLIFFFILLNITIFIFWKSIVWVRSVSIFLPLSQIIVTGKRIYTTDYDIRRSVLNRGAKGTFVTQDIRSIQEKIKYFSWIKQVSVRKEWPDKIKIHIIEYIPVAYWNNIYMITKDAVVFNVPKEYINREFFPFLFGPSGSERGVLRSYYIFNEILQSSTFKIKSVSMDHRCSWEIVLNDGVKLILGRENNVLRLQRFIEVYPVFLKKYMKKKNEFISYIDLRYGSGFSVKKGPIVQYKN